MSAIIYCRVSTDQQAESGAGISAQEMVCRKWAEKNYVNVSSVFIEEGISGISSLEKRFVLLFAIESLMENDILLVSSRDRLGRDPFSVAMIEAGVARKKARLISAAGEGTDSDDPGAVLMRRMIDAFSEFERNIIRGRIKGAMAAKKLKGECVGHIPFGFQRSSGSIKIEQNPKEQQILKLIAEMHRSGQSLRKIASFLNCNLLLNRNRHKWNHESVRNALKRALVSY